MLPRRPAVSAKLLYAIAVTLPTQRRRSTLSSTIWTLLTSWYPRASISLVSRTWPAYSSLKLLKCVQLMNIPRRMQLTESPCSLIGAIRKKYPDLPIHVHSHDTAGIAAASMLAAAAAGADVVDVAIDSMSGLTSQPSMGAVCMALEQTNLGTGIRYEDIQALNLYWTQVRQLYTCFEANVRASDSSVFEHEMPGGQYTNLMVSPPYLGSLHFRVADEIADFFPLVPSFTTWSWYSVGRYVPTFICR